MGDAKLFSPPGSSVTFDEALLQAEALNTEYLAAGSRLEAFPTGPMGLTPDDVKRTPEFQQAKRQYEVVFQRLRTFNAWYTKTFKKELHAHRQRLREQGLRSSSAGTAEAQQDIS